MAPSVSLTYTYTTRADIEAILSFDGAQGRLDDDSSGALSASEQGFVTKAISWATARVNLYLLGRYAASDLATSWIVNQWSTIVACYWLCCRRGNPAAGSIKDLYEETMEDLKLIRSGEGQLPDVALRTAAWPAWSNVRIDILYRLRKARVERPLSERRGGAPDYQQHRDIGADFLVEPN